jgi:LysM repeat protein
MGSETRLEADEKKERWGLTILAFLVIVGIFSFLLFKGGRTVVSDELVLAVHLDKAASGGVLYNYHPIRAGSSKAVPPAAGPEIIFEAPEGGEVQSATEEKGMSGKGSTRKATSGGATSGSEKTPGFIYHKVQSGDSLWKIAKRYNADIGDIVKDNSIRDPNVIYAGATLKITLRLS